MSDVRRLVVRTSGCGLVETDHGYQLYSALCARVPILHELGDLQVAPLISRRCGRDLLVADPEIELRAPVEELSALADALRGVTLQVGETSLAVVSSAVRVLRVAETMSARVVVVKQRTGTFEDALRWRMSRLGVERYRIGPRRVLRVAGVRVPGWQVDALGMGEDAALRLAAEGVGGRRRMGAGVFTVHRC